MHEWADEQDGAKIMMTMTGAAVEVVADKMNYLLPGGWFKRISLPFFYPSSRKNYNSSIQNESTAESAITSTIATPGGDIIWLIAKELSLI